MGTNSRRSFYRGLRLKEMSVMRERDFNCSFYREFNILKESLKIGEPKLYAKNGVFDSLTTVSFLYRKGCPLNKLFLKALWKLLSL